MTYVYDRTRKWVEEIALQEACNVKKCTPRNPVCLVMQARVAIEGYFQYNNACMIDETGLLWLWDGERIQAEGDTEGDNGGDYADSRDEAFALTNSFHGCLADSDLFKYSFEAWEAVKT